MIFELEDIIRIAHVTRTGSREICDPPPVDTDDDYLVEIDPIGISVGVLHQLLLSSGWERSNDYVGHDKIFSWRKHDVNLIVTDDSGVATRWRRATRIAKGQNLLKKSDRIDYFESIVYNRGPLRGFRWKDFPGYKEPWDEVFQEIYPGVDPINREDDSWIVGIDP